MLDEYSKEMQSKCVEKDAKSSFLIDEIKILEETKAIGLPNFLPKAAFLTLLQKQVKSISVTPFEFVDKTWSYLENILISVLMQHSDNYPQLLSSTRRAAQNLVAKKKAGIGGLGGRYRGNGENGRLYVQS
ncbi:UNVERIFIED_CONTAM: Dynamin-related protein 4C [Sesamum latifolium]|uniref:Dynamin-related protein 4C n=1 Tax=Sesamum latifolium TaxID=2727402 RepID=A0AAW2SMR6_9LAMI